MKTNDFKIPLKEQMSLLNQDLFDSFADHNEMVPNLMASLACSEHAFVNFFNLAHASSSLTPQQKVAVKLVVSEANHSHYCTAVHTTEASELGFLPLHILQLRAGVVDFDEGLAALVAYAKMASLGRGHVSGEILERFFEAGHSYENLADVIVVMAEKTITNYFHAATGVPLDFRPTFELDSEEHYN